MIIELHEQNQKDGTISLVTVNIFAIRKIRPASSGTTMIFFDNENLRVTESYAEVNTLVRGEVAELVRRLLANLIEQA